MANINTTDKTEKRINLVYDAKTDSYKALDISALDKGGSTISNFTPSGSNGVILQANANREELFIQNLSTNTLFVKYGEGAADDDFNFVLSSGSANLAGDGGILSDLNYTGMVSVDGGNVVNYISWERS